MIHRILNLMDINHVTAKQLTSDLQLSGSAISEWKKGKGKPSTDAVIKIAKYFKVSADYILGIDGEPKEMPVPTNGDGLNEKKRMAYERLSRLTPENLDIAIGQLDVLLTHQEKREKN